MIQENEILMGRDEEYPLSDELKANLQDLLEKVNKFRQIYGVPMYVTSGYRPGHYNTDAGGAKNSAHEVCQAVDFKDEDGKLFEFIKNNPDVLEQCDLYVENPGWTKNWLHMQVRKPASGHRIFIPYSDGRPATAPNRVL